MSDERRDSFKEKMFYLSKESCLLISGITAQMRYARYLE